MLRHFHIITKSLMSSRIDKNVSTGFVAVMNRDHVSGYFVMQLRRTHNQYQPLLRSPPPL